MNLKFRGRLQCKDERVEGNLYIDKSDRVFILKQVDLNLLDNTGKYYVPQVFRVLPETIEVFLDNMWVRYEDIQKLLNRLDY